MRELAADHGALESNGRRALAGALLKVVRGPAWPELDTAAAIGGSRLLDLRIDQLESGVQPTLGSVPLRTAALSVLAVAFLVAGIATVLVALGGTRAALDPGDGGGAATAAMATLCALPWVAAGWILLKWRRG